MYSSGSPEGGSDSSENRGEFLEKLQRAKGLVKPGTPSQPIMSHPSAARIVVGNWAITCKKEGEVQIHNSDGQHVSLAISLIIPFKTWVKVFRIIPEFRVLRLTFYRKSASKP